MQLLSCKVKVVVIFTFCLLVMDAVGVYRRRVALEGFHRHFCPILAPSLDLHGVALGLMVMKICRLLPRYLSQQVFRLSGLFYGR